MPYLSGVFEQFPDLDKISLLNLSSWLKVKIDKYDLVNILGNRILYPQTVALNKADLEIDLAILKEAVKQRPALIFDPQTYKIFIPELFLQRFPPLSRLAGALIEGINPKGLIQIYLKYKNNVKLVGSVVSPPDASRLADDKGKVKIIFDGEQRLINNNTLSVSHIASSKVKLKIGDMDYLASGGELGIVIDLRSENK